MKNPLNKRLPREIRGDFGKYLVIFLLTGALYWIYFRISGGRQQYDQGL